MTVTEKQPCYCAGTLPPNGGALCDRECHLGRWIQGLDDDVKSGELMFVNNVGASLASGQIPAITVGPPHNPEYDSHSIIFGKQP